MAKIGEKINKTEVEQARKVFGANVAHLSDTELQAYLSKIQYLIDCWLDQYERSVFDGKTISELV